MLNELSLSLQELNALSNISMADVQEVSDTVTQEIDELEIKCQNVLNALAVPIFDPMKMIANFDIVWSYCGTNDYLYT